MKSRTIFFLGGLLSLLTALTVVAADAPKAAGAEAVAAAAEHAKAEAPAAKGKAPAKKETPIALTVEAIQELEDRKEALDARERVLTEKAKALEIQEKVLKEKLKRMEELHGKMAERLDGFQKEHEGKVTKLVAVVEGMKPAAAAEYVENLDPELAVEILARMNVTKASKLLNLVDKKKSARLTELYTGYRDKVSETNGAPSAGPAPASVPASGKETPSAGKPNS